MGETLAKLLPEVERLAEAGPAPASALQATCALLAERVAHYDWVGYYLVDPESPRELFLGPYVGEPTEHGRIPFGRGICGQAAETEETFIVQDVTAESNYLSCSLSVRSEIVVPVFHEGRIVGEIDIDSHALAPFTEEDRALLERVAELTAPLCEAARRFGP
jgi:L-methionine (R)-S-oxide reductase